MIRNSKWCATNIVVKDSPDHKQSNIAGHESGSWFVMRLAASERGAEPPMEKYIRFKNDISLWYAEMKRYGLTQEEVEAVQPHFAVSYGVPPSQEQLMRMLMDPNICSFTLAEANDARKVVAKKQTKRIPELRKKIIAKAKSKNLGKYIWECGIKPQASYSFSMKQI